MTPQQKQCSDANEPESREWQLIDTAPRNVWVEVTGDSGMRSPPHFLALAIHDANHRPLSPWRDVQRGALSDHGWVPTHWRPAGAFPNVRSESLG